MSRYNLNEIMPFVLLWIPWLLAMRELYNHFRHAHMTEYLRRSSENDVNSATRKTTAAQHPFSYRLLFLFYAGVAILVPVLTVYVLHTRSAA